MSKQATIALELLQRQIAESPQAGLRIRIIETSGCEVGRRLGGRLGRALLVTMHFGERIAVIVMDDVIPLGFLPDSLFPYHLFCRLEEIERVKS